MFHIQFCKFQKALEALLFTSTKFLKEVMEGFVIRMKGLCEFSWETYNTLGGDFKFVKFHGHNG
jgi:hypothetical protein